MSARKLLAGYWHNFANDAGVVRLVDTPDAYDIVIVAFGVPAKGSTSAILLPLMECYSESQLASEIGALRRLGKKVLLSIGGAEATVQLVTDEDVVTFVRSVRGLVERYGFDGIDLDLENHSLFLDADDLDLYRPTTPVVVNLIAAVKALRRHFGPRFLVTLAPETFFVQQGFTNYGPRRAPGEDRAGCVLPLLENLRDDIGYVWVQQYNSEPIRALDGNVYSCGEPGFHAAMAEMLLKGFPVASEIRRSLTPFEPSRLLLGIPAAKEAGAGYLDSRAITQVLSYLHTGQNVAGSYELVCRDGYSGFGGVMMWSINWDVFAGGEMSRGIRAALDTLKTWETTASLSA